jgi:hypothetical protein
MKAFTGKKIKIFFNNGMSVEGVLNRYEDDTFVLSSNTSEDLLLVYDNKDNILFVRIIFDSPSNNVDETLLENTGTIEEPPPLEVDYSNENFEEVAQNLVTSKEEQIKKLKCNIAQYLSNPNNNIVSTNYVLPNFKK